MILEAKMLKKKYVWACCDQYYQMLKEHSIIKQQNELIADVFSRCSLYKDTTDDSMPVLELTTANTWSYKPVTRSVLFHLSTEPLTRQPPNDWCIM